MEVSSVTVLVLVITLHSAFSNPLDCTVIQCVNGGTCVQTNDGARCECPLGYTGSMCQDTTCPPDFRTYAASVFPDLRICIGYIQPWCNGSAASDICRRAGGGLIVLSDQAKYNAFKKYGEQYPGTGFWVNAAKNDRDGQWYWADGTRINSSGFQKYMPQPGPECLLISHEGTYYIVNCNGRTFLALCEAQVQ